jgi:hypothetical protein
MKCIAIMGAVLAAAVAVTAADPALASSRHHKKIAHQCADPPRDSGVFGFLFNPAPQPNGCAPPVYVNGRYQGQDPDPFIRSQILRDPQTGYSPY